MKKRTIVLLAIFVLGALMNGIVACGDSNDACKRLYECLPEIPENQVNLLSPVITLQGGQDSIDSCTSYSDNNGGCVDDCYSQAPTPCDSISACVIKECPRLVPNS